MTKVPERGQNQNESFLISFQQGIHCDDHCHNDHRERKAGKILAVLQDFLGAGMAEYNCLDVGCSRGIISGMLARHFKFTIGVDVDLPAVSVAAQNAPVHSLGENQPVFTFGSGEALPYASNRFDVVVCAQVYEHVTNQEALAREVERVLRPGGICFFSGPNRLAVIEEHYWLPFLSWLPRRLASFYMKLFKRGNYYDAYPLFYRQIRWLWRNFEIHDYTLRLMREPYRFSVSERVKKYPWLKFIPDRFLRSLQWFYPNYNWILVKR